MKDSFTAFKGAKVLNEIVHLKNLIRQMAGTFTHWMVVEEALDGFESLPDRHSYSFPKLQKLWTMQVKRNIIKTENI